MEKEKVSFLSGNRRLEGVLAYTRDKVPAPGIAVCHPHPQYGGSMDNNVVQALLHEFAVRGYVVLAFNFRGVGMSQGAYGAGEGEQEDVRAAMDFLEALPHTQAKGLGLCGYSFGAWVGLWTSTKDMRVQCVGAISPPASMFSFDFLHGYERPVIVVSGERDQFCVSEDVDRVLSFLHGPKEWKVLSGADHFYIHKAKEAAEYICERFRFHLPPASEPKG